jgi:hypothetical protein
LKRVVDETNSVGGSVPNENTESPAVGGTSVAETRSIISQSIKGRR